MKVIICNPDGKFNMYNAKIHKGFIQYLEGYELGKGFKKWANENIVNVVTGSVAIPLPSEGLRYEILMEHILTDSEKNEIIEIDESDEDWFPKEEIN